MSVLSQTGTCQLVPVFRHMIHQYVPVTQRGRRIERGSGGRRGERRRKQEEEEGKTERKKRKKEEEEGEEAVEEGGKGRGGSVPMSGACREAGGCTGERACVWGEEVS